MSTKLTQQEIKQIIARCHPKTIEKFKQWDEKMQQKFCAKMQECYRDGLDIFTVDSHLDEVRIGRKEIGADAKRIYLYLGINEKGFGEYPQTNRLTDKISFPSVKDFLAEYPLPEDRQPYWPNDYLGKESSNTQDKSPNNKEEESVTNNSTEEISMATPLNQILYGPPGTGKTYHTIEEAVKAAEPKFPFANREKLVDKYNKLVNDGRIRFVTFHQSYGYEEFIEGLSAETEDGQISYNVKDGIFKSIAKKAAEDKPKNYVLIIDEINRGNISKIFGELITLIEPSKRKGANEALSLTLPYSGEEFSVPNNLYIIGTMNTADRSLTMLDTALRRRFDFIEMMPDPSLLENNEVEGINLTTLLKTLNERIEVLYDREHTLGHAFFFPVMNAPEDKALSLLKSIFQNKIIPLLQEYFYDDWNKIRLVLGDNQKPNESLCFISAVDTAYDEIFGNNHGLDSYDDSKVIYSLKSYEDGVWGEAEAYKAIYAKSESTMNESSDSNESE